ncbi:MAG: DUF547 domain-containing protein [Hyphomicrobiales bacterium]|nr:DUF547 domain-containing protein [Hyphomicrobiales bacterium]
MIRQESSAVRRLGAAALLVLAAGLAPAGCQTANQVARDPGQALEAWLVPDPEPWAVWRARDDGSGLTVDHDDWSALLRAHMTRDHDGVNRLDYDAFTAADRDRLDAYLRRLTATPVEKLSGKEQLAYWINLYNALVVRLVLSRYPVASVRDIDLSAGVLTSGPWERKLVEVRGRPLSLNDIEHRILRPLWRDPRVHYLLNKGAVGSPNLRPEALTAGNIDIMLEGAAREFVNSPRGVRMSDDGLVVSRLFAWYADDFGGAERRVLDHLRRYAVADVAADLSRVRQIAGYQFDWSLNEPHL